MPTDLHTRKIAHEQLQTSGVLMVTSHHLLYRALRLHSEGLKKKERVRLQELHDEAVSLQLRLSELRQEIFESYMFKTR